MAIITAPPKVLTMDEYQQEWQPEGWQLIIIGPTSTWRQEWGEWEAIRDIVQNALDECEYYTYGYDDDGLYIRDLGKGIAVADFLLGPPKLKPDYARGKFGEGMKIAALALLRLGYSVRIETKGRVLWVVFVEQKTNGHAQTLAALWKPNGRAHGTCFHIIGYRGTAFEDRFAVNLPKKAIVNEGPSLLLQPTRRFNQLIRYDFGNGEYGEMVEAVGMKSVGTSRIFARDIYMRDVNSPYGYNLWSFDMAPDRHGPKNEPDLWTDIGRLWCCVTKIEHLQVFLKMVKEPPLLEADETRYVNMGSWDMGREPSTGRDYADFVRENAPVWREAWRKVIGENAVIRTSERLDSMVRHLGYESVSLQHSVRDTLGRAITTDRDLVRESQARLREVEVIPDDKLEFRHRAHIKLARAITAKVYPYSPPSGVYVAVIPPASDLKRTAGMYSTGTGEVYISLEMMGRCKTMIDTLVHELAHHRQFRSYGEADDLTPLHMEAMQWVAAEVIEAIASGALDESLKEVVW
ncbi:MAG: hypothetical protein PHH57_06065 [Candidatus Omnitrophica bacterium]|nr:hypothetical protein [Candidatus Omnitrophota bacterium]